MFGPMTVAVLLVWLISFGASRGFAPLHYTTNTVDCLQKHHRTQTCIFLQQKGGDATDEDTALYVSLTRQALEYDWIKQRSRSRPRFFPYERCRLAVQATWLVHSEEEWKKWIMQGEKNNCLIPSDPEAVYGKQGTWISWEDFLGKR